MKERMRKLNMVKLNQLKLPELYIETLKKLMLSAGKDKTWEVTYWIVREGVELIEN